MHIAGHYANCLVGVMALYKLPNEGDILKNAAKPALCILPGDYVKCPISHITHNIYTIKTQLLYIYICLNVQN